MKNYKSVNSFRMRKKAEVMGLEISDHFDNEAPFIVFEFSVGRCWTSESYDLDDDFEEITQADFLALPEPIKVGDWVMVADNYGYRLFKVGIVENNGGIIRSDIGSSEFISSMCTKLNSEQIKVLGLEG